ncbi:Fic family protein [Geomonas paludis]|uniref:Fic family protein n=1 Tax=Geomonas paludis TaxID=2740185 RepID=A0A6V8N3K0_9BACT|nr:Fic family protein [Geomonas paludis]
MTGGYLRTIPLPGVTFVQLKGPGRLDSDMPFVSAYMSSRARMLLENLTPSRVRGEESKNVDIEEIERKLVDILNAEKEDGINRLRDQAREISDALGYNREFEKLDKIIGALLGTRQAALVNPVAKAQQLGVPYDADALMKAEALRAALAQLVYEPMPTKATGSAFYNIGFFDAYFSNYIEGTQFEVDEAKDIIDTGLVPLSRPSDGHDIIGTYRVVSSLDDMRRTPRSAEEFLELLRSRHSEIMTGRPDKHPGQFKEEVNYAGATRFVDPALVKGTLLQGFGLYTALENPFARALLIMFLVAEVHPFDDGNGRTARAMMNAELVATEQTRIIVPSVFRNEYVSSLKRITNHQQPESFIKVMSFAQKFVHSIDFRGYETAKYQMAKCNAFEDPADDKRLHIFEGER